MTAPTLHTKRLTLRAHQMADLAPMAGALATDHARYVGGPIDEKESWSMLCRDVAQWDLVGHGAWAVDLTETGEFLGQVGLGQHPYYPEPELGWFLLPNSVGKGIALEAATAAKSWAEACPEINSLVSYIHKNNTRSCQLAERLGAVLDADAEPAPYSDHLVYRHTLKTKKAAALPRCTQAPTSAAADMAARLQTLVPRLETARLVLRAANLDDFPIWVDLFEEEETEFEGGAEGAWAEYTNYVAGWLLHGHGLMAVENKTDGKTIGFVLLGLEWEDYEPELGWMLAKSARGHGYASEAAAALRDYGLDLLGPGKFVSYIYQDNLASKAVADRIGASFDDTAPGDPDTLIYRHGAQQ